MTDSKDLLKELSKPLEASEIEFRVQSISANGWAILLAYKDARVDINRLNKVCGVLGWKREHTRDNKNCVVSIWDPEKSQWVSKEDTGKESNSDAEKGLASDSFKRACFNFGIGIELYDYPLIMVQLKENEYEKVTQNGRTKGKATYDLKLKDWFWVNSFEDGKITSLIAKDEKGVQRFSMNNRNPSPQNPVNNSSSVNQSGDKPWYNSFEDEKGIIGGKIRSGEATPETIISHLEKTYKISKQVRESIKNIT